MSNLPQVPATAYAEKLLVMLTSTSRDLAIAQAAVDVLNEKVESLQDQVNELGRKVEGQDDGLSGEIEQGAEEPAARRKAR